MATGGSISITSDEVLDHLCSVCKNKNISTEASVYCADCKDYYCNTCVDVHKDIPALRDHVILSQDAGDGGKLPSVPTSRCDEQTMYIIDTYCQDEDGCIRCMTINHRRCKNVYDIPEFVGKNTDIVPEFIQTVKDIESELKYKLNVFHREQEELQQNKKDVTGELEATRDRFIDIIRKQTEDTIQKMEEKYDELNNELQSKVTIFSNEITKLDKLLKDMKLVSHNVPQSFVLSKISKDVVSRAEQLCADIKLVEIGLRMEFIPNTMHEEFITYENSDLGHVIKTKLYKFSQINDINMKDGDLHYACCTTNGSVFVTNFANNCLHRIRNDAQGEVEELQLPSSPSGVCCVSNTEIAVGLDATIQMIDVANELKIIDSIKVNHDVRGLYHDDDIFYVTNGDSVYKNYRNGELLQSYSKYSDGDNIFSDIYNLVVNPINSHIHVADAANGVITMDQDGDVLNVVEDNISGPWGICVDQYGQVFASGIRSNNIIRLSCDGRYKTTVVSEGLDEPTGICFDITRGKFYVNNNWGRDVQVFKVETALL